MEWDLKLPPWDLAELDRDAVPGIGSVVGPSGGPGCQANLLDCSVDLKLGRLGELGPSDKWKEQAKATAMVPPPSGSSKRARMPSNSSQNAPCSVDGCRADLSNCREYHRRHKVCEVHSKTPVVMVGGQEQRFCQQCSRFHLLIEFDEVKRSCRKRLDGHNRRRRKSQPDSINSANVFPTRQGPRFSSYPQIFSTATSPNWAGIIQTERDSVPTHCRQLHHMDRQHLNSSLAQTFKEGKQFPFLQDTDTVCGSRTAFETSVHQPLHKIIEKSRNKMFSEGLVNVLDSDCALSLLSTTTQTSGINLGQMVPAGRIPVGLPLVSSMQYGDVSQHSHSQVSNSSTRLSCSGMEDEHVGTILVSDASDTHLHCQSMFHVGCQGSSNGTSSSIPFPWQ